MAFIQQQDLLSATNGGLEIILTYYPQASDALKSARKEFKIRNERTPSARIKQLDDGNWVVTDYGDDSVSRNAIQICMKEETISYREALVKLASRYGIGGIKADINKSGFEKRQATAEEAEGETYFDIKEAISEHEMAELGPCVNEKVCKKYNVYALNSFTRIKNREAMITSSNENYPIFLVEHDTFKKIYQPKNAEKQYRFFYVGNRPKDYVNGLKQVRAEYQDLQEEHESESQDDGEAKKKKAPKLGEIIIASGERDALNVAGLGYNVIWLNSETATVDKDLWIELTKMAHDIYNLPDIDVTGRRQAVKLGMKYLDIKTIWLPEKLAEYKDHRGRPRKDFRDYVDIWPHDADFKKLMRVAMPMRFWDEEYDNKGIKYQLNNIHAYYFLESRGFFLFENRNIKGGVMCIHIDGNIVTSVEFEEGARHVQQFLKDQLLPTPLRNSIHRSSQLSESSLKGGLKLLKIDFTDYDKDTQYLFFSDRTWRVTAAEVEEIKSAQVEKFVWKEEVIDKKVRLKDPPFQITLDKGTGEYDIEITDSSSHFFRFLVNASRIHWRTEYETRRDELLEDNRKYFAANRWNIAGPRLEHEEALEQKQHLINKIFSIGYLMHRYKDPARPWCVFAMDNKITDTGESHGRSGKSFCYRALRLFMKSVTLNGRNPKLTENPHVYDRVTEHTDYVLIDDADQYLNFGFFFNALQGDLEVNPKNNKSYEIPFENVPKFCITSNFTLRNIDPSTEGRILYSVFSDYYHVRTEAEDYAEDFTIRDDFGKNLFLDYTEEEWNADFNFFAYCLKFYLGVPRETKLNPPLNNVNKRNLRTEMTEVFKDWADVFFDANQGQCDQLVVRDAAYKDFSDKSGQHKWTTNRFTRAIKAWAKYTDYVIAYNPEALRNSSGRVSRSKKDPNNSSASGDMIFIQTKELSAEVISSVSKQEKKMDKSVKLF